MQTMMEKDKKKMISDDRRRIKWFEDRLWEWLNKQ